MPESSRPLCAVDDCLSRAEVLVHRGAQLHARPSCDRHAMWAALDGERHGSTVVISSLPEHLATLRRQAHDGAGH